MTLNGFEWVLLCCHGSGVLVAMLLVGGGGGACCCHGGRGPEGGGGGWLLGGGGGGGIMLIGGGSRPNRKPKYKQVCYMQIDHSLLIDYWLCWSVMGIPFEVCVCVSVFTPSTVIAAKVRSCLAHFYWVQRLPGA